MGAFAADCRITNLYDRDRETMVADLLVDTGSEFTWIDRATLEELGVRVERRRSLATITGERITREVGYVIVGVEGDQTVDEVVFGESGDKQVLGSRSLEGMALWVDPTRKRLAHAGAHLAMGGITALPEE